MAASSLPFPPAANRLKKEMLVAAGMEKEDKDFETFARPAVISLKEVECWSGRCNPCLNRAFFCRPEKTSVEISWPTNKLCSLLGFLIYF